MKSDSISLSRRGVLAAGGAAALASLLPTASRAASGLPPALRIAVVARTNAAGQTRFTGASAEVAEQGWLEAELRKLGVALQWVPVTSNSVAVQVNEAFASHAIDFAHYGDLPSVIANASGLRTRLVVPGGGLSNTYLVVPPGSSARSIQDLKGKRIALHRGRPWEFPFSRLLAQSGMSNRDIRLLNLNPQAGAAALGSGAVDAFFTLSDGWLLVDKGLGRIIWDSKQAPRSWQMRAELWGDQAFIAANPELTQLVVDAFVKNARWASDEANREQVIRIGAAAGIPESVIRRDYAGTAGSWKERASPLFTPALADHYRDLAAYARKSGLVAKDVDIVGTFEPRYVQSALDRFGLKTYWDGASR